MAACDGCGGVGAVIVDTTTTVTKRNPDGSVTETSEFATRTVTCTACGGSGKKQG